MNSSASMHRAGKAKGKKSRLIITPAAKRSYLRRESQLLKDRTYSVFKDMPKELYELRKANLKNCRMRESGDTAYFSSKYPYTLFINGKYIPLN